MIEEVSGEDAGVIRVSLTRFLWLGCLLMLQSISSFVLESYKELIHKHLVVTLFLTMLVGAGGNAGAQAAVSVIRGIATGRITKSNRKQVLLKEFAVGVLLATGLCVVG